MSETPLHFKTITELAELIKSKALSPVEVTDAMLERIRERDQHYKSYATVLAEQARTSAQAAERAISTGNYLGTAPRGAHRRQRPVLHQRREDDGRHQGFDESCPGF